MYKEVVQAQSNYTKFTSGDLGIPLLVIQLGVTGFKKTRLQYPLDLSERRGEKEQRDLVCAERL